MSVQGQEYHLGTCIREQSQEVNQITPVHKTLKCGWSIAQSKWNYCELPKSTAGRKSSFLLILRFHFDLPVATLKVEGREPFHACELIRGIVNPWKGVGLFSGYCIQLWVIHAKTSYCLYLSSELRQVRPRDCLMAQSIPVCVGLPLFSVLLPFYQMGVDAGVVEWGLILGLNLVYGHTCPSNIITTCREKVGESTQETMY